MSTEIKEFFKMFLAMLSSLQLDRENKATAAIKSGEQCEQLKSLSQQWIGEADWR